MWALTVVEANRWNREHMAGVCVVTPRMDETDKLQRRASKTDCWSELWSCENMGKRG